MGYCIVGGEFDMDRVLGSIWRRVAHPGVRDRHCMCPVMQQCGTALL